MATGWRINSFGIPVDRSGNCFESTWNKSMKLITIGEQLPRVFVFKQNTEKWHHGLGVTQVLFSFSSQSQTSLVSILILFGGVRGGICSFVCFYLGAIPGGSLRLLLALWSVFILTMLGDHMVLDIKKGSVARKFKCLSPYSVSPVLFFILKMKILGVREMVQRLRHLPCLQEISLIPRIYMVPTEIESGK